MIQLLIGSVGAQIWQILMQFGVSHIDLYLGLFKCHGLVYMVKEIR